MIGNDPTGKQKIIDETDLIHAQNVLIKDAVDDLSNSLQVLTETGGTITTDGSEQTIYTNNAPTGLYTPVIFLIDLTNNTAGETVLVREYYRIKSGGGYIEYKETSYAGVQDPDLKMHSLFDNRYGVKITVEKTGGANKDYDWEIVYKL